MHRSCIQIGFVLSLLASLHVIYAFVAPHYCAHHHHPTSRLAAVKKTGGNDDTSTRKRSPVKKQKKKKGVPRSKAKQSISRYANTGKHTTFVRKPPLLLANYEANTDSDRQDRRCRDDSIGQCEHYQDCSGCSIGVNVANTSIVRAAKRFFADNRYDGTNSRIITGTDDDDDQSYPVVIPSALTGWRTQAKLAVANKSKSSWMKDGCVFGLYKQGSHEVLPIPMCKVHHPAINAAIRVLEQATTKAGISAYSEISRDGDLRYVQLQVERVTGNVSLTLVWNAASLKECQPALARLVKELNKQQAWHSIWCHCHDGLGNNIFSRAPGRWHRLSGPEFLREPFPVESSAGSTAANESVGWLYFTPLTFRQGNLDGFDILALDVARAVPGGSKVCELYAGVGVLGLTALAYNYEQQQPLQWLRCSDENPSSPRCFHRAVDSLPKEMTGRQTPRGVNRGGPTKRKHGNDDDDEGMTLAELAQLMEDNETPPFQNDEKENGVEKTSYMIATAGKALKSGQALGANVLIVDPPRRGLEDEVMDELCKRFNPNQPYVESDTLLAIPDEKVNWANDVQTLIYVSCGFDALARDCDRLLSSTGGWTLQISKGYILFPGSDHVESLVIFRRE